MSAALISAAIHLVLAVILAVWTLLPRFEGDSIALESRLAEGPLDSQLDLAVVAEAAEQESTEQVTQELASLAHSTEQPPIEEPPPVESADPLPVNSDAETPLAGAGADATQQMKSEVGFFGSSAQAESVVFVVDMSKSMTERGRFRRCIIELTRAINRLVSGQRFYVVFFNDQPEPLFFPRTANGMQPATLGIKQRAIRWIQTRRPSGITNPDLALQRALDLEPGAIYFLTDSDLENSIELRRQLVLRNSRRIPIHTIAFQNPAGQVTLSAIAEESGGSYRFVK